MSQSDPIVIVGAARTPMGGFQGDFASLPAARLGSVAVAAAVARAGVPVDAVSEALIGCVLPAGQGQAPARQAALGAGLPQSVPCSTVNKMCGSGMATVMFAHDALHARPRDIIVAGGMESMSNAPYLLPKARTGLRIGHGAVMDHMFLDGLEDAYERGRLMGTFAEDTAAHYQISREEQDAYAHASLARALAAIASGAFAREIAPVTVEGRGGAIVVDTDEQPGKADAAKIGKLKPAFRPGGTVTAANSSSISDGAAALVLMRASEAERRGLTPRARIVGTASHARAPAWFSTAPIGAIETLFERIGWNSETPDLYEINEAFAVVAMVAMRDLGLDHARVNVNGGACALGHPIGASGARILVTLLHALENRHLKRGVASLCIGGGEATAVAIELM
ncbi:MAG: acetyl-CoA C-acyltransferase [Hyphomicrobiaceae bacterium]|nr:acetyl-CoA C-acyltransferase [Hyphomicrobiaceae bacterium]